MRKICVCRCLLKNGLFLSFKVEFLGDHNKAMSKQNHDEENTTVLSDLFSKKRKFLNMKILFK